MRMIQCEVASIRGTEYITFREKQDAIHERFRWKCLPDMLFLKSGTKLKIAIGEERIKCLQNHRVASVNFTSSDIFSLLLLSGSAPVLPESPVLSAVLLPYRIPRSVYQSGHRCPSRPVPDIFCSSLT